MTNDSFSETVVNNNKQNVLIANQTRLSVPEIKMLLRQTFKK